MKKFTKTIALALTTLIASAMLTICASADTKLTATVRIEGDEGNIFYDTVELDTDGKDTTAADLLSSIDTVVMKGVDTGFIYEVEGIAGGKYGGYDGWYYLVNGESPAVGVTDYKINDGDSVVLYYGGYPCQVPYADTDKLAEEGIIAFKSKDTEYDENWNATEVVNPVVNADVTIGDKTFKTDDNGEIKVSDDIAGVQTVQIEKKDASGAPAVLRFAPDYTIEFKSDSTETDTEETDTDTATDTDTSSTSSKVTSSSGGTTVTSTKTLTTTTTTAAAAEPRSIDAAQTGDDGRTYVVIGILAAAVVVGIVMILLRKKDDD